MWGLIKVPVCDVEGGRAIGFGEGQHVGGWGGGVHGPGRVWRVSVRLSRSSAHRPRKVGPEKGARPPSFPLSAEPWPSERFAFCWCPPEAKTPPTKSLAKCPDMPRPITLRDPEHGGGRLPKLCSRGKDFVRSIAGAGVGGALRGRSSTRDQRDACPTLTSSTKFPPGALEQAKQSICLSKLRPLRYTQSTDRRSYVASAPPPPPSPKGSRW